MLKVLCVSDSVGDALYSITYSPVKGARFSFLHYDRNTSKICDKDADEEVCRFYEENKPDLIISITQPHVDFVCNFKWIKELHNKTAIALLWYDSNEHEDKVNSMTEYAHQIVLDDQHFKGTKIIPTWTPFALPTYPINNKKDIGVYFGGRIDNQQREETLRYLLECGIPLLITGSNPWNAINIGSMYSYMQRSKIVLNFSRSRFRDTDHFKGRVIEAMMSGAMVLENKNNQSSTYFEPGKDLIHWEDLEDLINKIEFYLKNDQERIKIAHNGQKKCDEELNAEKWWLRLFDKILKDRPRNEAVPLAIY
jgi:spore maturation protein CgeB